MKTILDLIKTILSNKNLLIFLLIAAVAFLIMTNMNTCNAKKEAEANMTQNTEAMKKIVTVEKNKNGELQSSIVAYIGKTGDLEKYSSGLKDEVDALKHRKPEIIIKTKLVYMGDTSRVPNTLTDNGNGNYALKWDYTSKDSNRTIKGISSFNAAVDFNKLDFSYKLKINPGITSIDTDILKIGLVVGVAKNKKTGFDEIFVTPKDSNITIGSLEGAILNKKKDKKFSVGTMIGYGVTYNKNGMGFGPFVGIGLQYSLFKF